jgi:hypothetical protein
MDKLIEQAIKNCKINKYEKYFEQVCKEYKRLLEAESKQLNLADVSGSLFDFVQECERMISLYKNQRYTQAEQLRDKLSERLDDVMRGY